MNITTLKIHQAKLVTVVNVVLGIIILASTVFFIRALSDAKQHDSRHMLPLGVHSIHQTENTIKTYDAIIRDNPFRVPSGSLKQSSSATEPSALPDIKLAGTISGALTHGYAVFVNTDGTQSMFRTGEVVFGIGELVSVGKNNALIKKDGKLVKVSIIDLTVPDANGSSRNASNPSGFARPSGKGEYILDQRALQFALDNPAQIMTDAKLIPNMINNQQEGFVLNEVKGNGLYNKLGMRNGDVILRINGSDISNPENALQAFMALKGLDKVQLDLIRNGNRMALSYLIR
jgi:general secretion pathway protein C